MYVPEDATDDSPIVLDSLTLLTLQHLLGQRHGIDLRPTFDDMREFTSISRIHSYLIASCPQATATHAPDDPSLDEQKR